MVGVPADKPRYLQNNRDMIMSLTPLVIICLIVAGIAGSCAFRPGGPSMGQVPQYNVQVALEAQARQAAFPLRLPETPEGWTTNSGGTEPIANTNGGVAVNVGYYIDEPMSYLSLTQSDQPAETLIQIASGVARNPTGQEVIGDVTWSVFSDADAETIWVAQLPGVSVSIYGSAQPEQFTQLAEAFGEAKPLPTS